MAGNPYSNSKLDNLPQPVFTLLRESLLDKSLVSYKDILAWLEKEHGVKSTASSLSAFYKRHCKPVGGERRKLVASKAEGTSPRVEQIDLLIAAIERLVVAVERNTAAQAKSPSVRKRS